MQVSRLSLEQQFARVSAAGWLPFFEDAAKRYGFPVSVLLGIASRETNCKNILGDRGHGHGIMQIDDRSYHQWCYDGLWRDPKEAIRMGAAVLRHKQGVIVNNSIPANDVLAVSLAAYNCGERRAILGYCAGDPDKFTTGHDYSKDVLGRAHVFTELLARHYGKENSDAS